MTAETDASRAMTPRDDRTRHESGAHGDAADPVPTWLHEERECLRAPRVAVAWGTGADLSSETDALRQVRLRAAALLLLVALSISLARSILIGDSLVLLVAAVVTAQGAAIALLSDRRPVPPRLLKALEYGIFGLMAVYLAIRQYDTMQIEAGRGDAVAIWAAFKDSFLRSVLLMFVSGMLIPNTWQRAARIVLGIMAVPILTGGVFFLAHLEAYHLALQDVRFERLGEYLLLVLVAAGLSIYGTYVLSMMRRREFEARQPNQYRLLKPLGAGGMGEVYLAEHRLLKRPCALKLIRPDRAADTRSLARFEREVRATARLSHPNTIEIYDYGHTQDGTFYYVMEYLPGLSLADLVERHGPLPAGRVIYLLRQACEALAEAHGAGLIHRDLKPANLFAARRGGKDDVTKVLDFGLVKRATPGESIALSREGLSTGTPQFMAPEQVTGEPTLDHRCDLYALGGVAYALLTGRPPFEGDSASRVMIAHARDPVVPPSKHRPEVPEDLEQVVLRCLAKAPAGRFPDAESLGDALSACEAAGTWDAKKAESWWKEFEPEATRDPTP